MKEQKENQKPRTGAEPTPQILFHHPLTGCFFSTHRPPESLLRRSPEAPLTAEFEVFVLSGALVAFWSGS